jgi:hypothetical protein
MNWSLLCCSSAANHASISHSAKPASLLEIFRTAKGKQSGANSFGAYPFNHMSIQNLAISQLLMEMEVQEANKSLSD